jgi:hypothetical protein
MKNKRRDWIYWTPRILSVVFLLFLTLFSLDIFDSCNSFLNCALGLLIHNIPSLILIVILWISWRKEIVGGIAFILFGLIYAGLNLITISMDGFQWYYISWIIQISGFAFFIGILFLLGWKRKK